MCSCPRIVIAGANSGVGKTTVSLGLVVAMRKRGLRVQTFKVGPDYLDPTYLGLASERPCYNLDGWMTGKGYVQDLFSRATADADMAVIEGVMGLFDGADFDTLDGSTAEIAIWLDAPVLLIVNVHGVARSLAPIVKGFVEFESSLKIAGVISNQCGSPRHGEWLGEALKFSRLPEQIGAIPRGAFPELPNRHLGLVTADAEILSSTILDALGEAVERHVAVEKILEKAQADAPPQRGSSGEAILGEEGLPAPSSKDSISCSLGGLRQQRKPPSEQSIGVFGEGCGCPRRAAMSSFESPGSRQRLSEPKDALSPCAQQFLQKGSSPQIFYPDSPPERRVRIGLAFDEAFHFYYPDNLEEFERNGCDLIRFSPLNDKVLPAGLDGIYIGGGYPEEFAERLAENTGMLQSIKGFGEIDRPIYAECGGLMYLARGIETRDGKSHNLVGLFPAWTRMLDRLRSLGYVEVTLAHDSLFGKKGDKLRGHEFHYSELIREEWQESGWTAAYLAEHRRAAEAVPEGFQKGRILVSYIHMHFASRPESAKRFLGLCRETMR